MSVIRRESDDEKDSDTDDCDVAKGKTAPGGDGSGTDEVDRSITKVEDDLDSNTAE
jgi:hypothetical protein